jgi:hypothetical protein
MAIIYSYPDNTNILLTDLLIGTSTVRIAGKKKNLTKNFTVEALGNFISLNNPTVWGTIDGNLENQTDLWNALQSKQGNITLTTSGTEGPSTLIGDVLNIPQYSGGGSQNLQQVTDIGNITTNAIILDNTEPYGDFLSTNTLGSLYSNYTLVSSTTGVSFNADYGSEGIYLTSIEGATVNTIDINDSQIRVSYYDYDGINYGSVDLEAGVADNLGGYIRLTSLNAFGTIRVSSLTNNIQLEFPNKAAGTYIIATTDDIPSITPAALTKTDDTNVTLTLGGTPNTALLEATSLTLGWTGTLEDSRITSANTWNAKQNALSGSGIVKSTSGTISYIADNSTNWDTAYTNRITSLTTTGSGAATLVSNVLNIPTPAAATFTSLTTTGSSGASTLLSGVLNIPTYTLSGLGGVPDTRTLTINGVGYDLSADRSWTIATNAGTVTSIGMTVPSAFSVTPSSITTSGTFAITGAGTASQYIRGDGQLATFPTSGSGGSSVFYYLNGSVAASVATYKQMSNAAVIGTGTDFSLTGNGLIAQFLTDAGNPNRLEIPGGAWNFEMFFSMSSSGGTPEFYVELLKYDGAVFTSIANGSLAPETISGGTTLDLYLSSLAVPTTTLLLTDRLAVRVYIVNNSGGRTATLHTEDSHLCQIITTFSSGISAINGLTSNNQYLAVGTSGTDFNINSALETHTFNLPSASATARGLVTINGQTFAGAKTFSTAPILSSLTASQLLALDASKNIQSLDTATYPSLTELSYVKGVTSPIQTQLNAISNSIKSVVKDTVPKIITGTVSQTIVSSYLISANTFVANDFLRITNLMFSHSGLGTWVVIVYVNSSASLTGAVRIAGTSTQGATSLFGQLQKSFALDGTNMRGAGFGVLSFTDINSSTATIGSTAYNLTQDKYIIVTITPSLSADINTQEGINITN